MAMSRPYASHYILLPLFIALFFSAGCDAFRPDEETASGGVVSLSGQVLNADTAEPIAGAFVRILPFDLLVETTSDGRYDAVIEIDSTMDVSIQASKDGFSEASTNILALADRTITVPNLSLTPAADAPRESGRAANMLLLSQTANVIGVRESGSEEVATLTFQLADSVGRPVILNQSSRVRFSLGVRPGGGEEVAPLEAQTNDQGQVNVTLSSGTRAGIVQVIAETDVAGRTVRSQPVALTIHGGHPDQAHFSLGPLRRNFPGLNFIGLTNEISVIVGDKFSNPVRPGTSVNFSSTHGIIGGSTLTDADGRGSVDLTSANPLPADGIAHITAVTADEQQNRVTATTPVVFSGTPALHISPGVARIDQAYTMTVTDGNGNPLVAGTTITVTAEGTAVKATGNTEAQIPETSFVGGMNFEHVVRGPGMTQFQFFVVENIDPDAPAVPNISSITIELQGENGSLEIALPPEGGTAPRVVSHGDGDPVFEKTSNGYRFSVTPTR